MNPYNEIAKKIIKEQELLMGSVAWNQAGKVNGLKVINEETGEVSIDESKDNKAIIDELVNNYGNLFGPAARQVCKEAVIAIISDLPQSEVPLSLQT